MCACVCVCVCVCVRGVARAWECGAILCRGDDEYEYLCGPVCGVSDLMQVGAHVRAEPSRQPHHRSCVGGKARILILAGITKSKKGGQLKMGSN